VIPVVFGDMHLLHYLRQFSLSTLQSCANIGTHQLNSPLKERNDLVAPETNFALEIDVRAKITLASI
jgi:hypothetical protein